VAKAVLASSASKRPKSLTPDLRLVDIVSGIDAHHEGPLQAGTTRVHTFSRCRVMTENVLLVDCSGSSQALTQLFENAGFDVSSVAEADIGRTVIPSKAPRVILLGVDAASLSIPAFLRVRELAPDSALIVLGAYSDINTKVRFLELGADEYVETPFEPLELVARVRALARRIRLRV
jgi:response regulator RpfG family c-di-GMP phosphodiesterase